MAKVKIHMNELEELPEIHSEIVGQGRWETRYNVVSKSDVHGPVMYQLTRGSTEYQDMDPESMYNLDKDGMVEVTQVELRDVVVKKWMPIPEATNKEEQ